jgi:hypothetical protein
MQLFPHLVHVACGAGTHEPVDAAIKGVAFALPSGAQSAGLVVHLEDLGIEAVHLQLAAHGQSGYTAPNDVYFNRHFPDPHNCRTEL